MLALAALAFAVTRGGGGEKPGSPAPGGTVSPAPTPSLSLPSGFPSSLPSLPSDLPTNVPTGLPSGFPTDLPSDFPTDLPGSVPTGPLSDGLVSAAVPRQLP